MLEWLKEWSPWIIGVLGPISVILAGRKSVWGWVVLAIQHVLFFIFAIITKQYGFITMNIVMFSLSVWNTWKWRKPKKSEVAA